MDFELKKEDLVQARERISGLVHETPLLSSSSLNKIAGASIFFKCENFQKGGAFKIRGASNAVLSLSEEELSKGIITHSSGNHAQALAIAGSIMGTKAMVVMPKNSSKVKVEAVKGYAGHITWSDPDLCSREDTLDLVKNQTGATFIHPYDDHRIIAGQSTVGQEMIDQADDKFDMIIAPVGGGGLMSGVSLASHYFSPRTRVFGAEPSLASDAKEGLDAGEWVAAKAPITIADGLRTALGRKNFDILSKVLEDVLLVEEEEIVAAMKMIWERMKLVVEPSGAVAFATVLKNPQIFSGKKVGVVISGGNVDLSSLPEVFGIGSKN